MEYKQQSQTPSGMGTHITYRQLESKVYCLLLKKLHCQQFPNIKIILQEKTNNIW